MNPWRLDWMLILFSILSVLMGVLVLHSGGEAGESYAMRKLVLMIPGIAIMIAFAFLNYQKLGSFAPIIYSVALFFLAITLLPFIGTKINGARSWIRFGPLGLQPIEFFKVAFVIAMSRYLILRETEIGKLKELVIPGILTIIPAFFVALQPDLGSAMILFILVFTLLFIGGANQSVLFGGAIVGFISIFIPLYIEYERYIRVYDVIELLKDTQFKVADAVRILKFEVWHLLENAADAQKAMEDSSLRGWAVKTLTTEENRTIFLAAAEEARKANPDFLRDYLNSNTAILITMGISLVLYIVGQFSYLFIKIRAMKSMSTVMMIITLSLSGGFLLSRAVDFKPHQVVRIVSFANPDKFPQGAGYQLRHSLITLGSGEAFGKGLYQGDMTRGKTPFLPEWHNDFIFSVIGEQLGFFGNLFTLFLLFGIVFRGISIALASKDDYGGILAAGISFLFFSQIVINVGIAIGLFPVTGIPLIFVSHGNSSMLANFAAVGILLNINRRRFINA